MVVQQTNYPPLEEQDSFQYLALGDSYTIGEGVNESERWPVVLIDRLKQEGIPFNVPKIIATTGWTTTDLIAAIDKEDLATFNLVSLLIGVNNQYRGYDFNIYKAEFRDLLIKAIKLAGNDPSKVFVVSIPDYSVTPFAQSRNPQKIASEIDAYNKFNKDVAIELGVAYFDITPISRNAANDDGLLAEDNLHPSAKMYHEWVDMIYPEIKSKF